MTLELSRADFLRMVTGVVLHKAAPRFPIPALVFQTQPLYAEQPALFDALINPFLEDATKRRANRVGSYDPDLNSSRVNFLLFGYGNDYQPPNTRAILIGSQTILSFDIAKRRFDVVSLTHDTRAPEIKRYTNDGRIFKTFQAFEVGGFYLMRRVLENATGLAVDYQMAFFDQIIADGVDSVIGKLEMDVPVEVKVGGFYLGDTLYDPLTFPKGRQKFDGVKTLQYLKSVADDNRAEVENNERKHQVFKALAHSFSKNAINPMLWLRSYQFWRRSVDNGTIQFDFDIEGLLLKGLQELALNFPRYLVGRREIPGVNRSLYIVDPKSGDGGVQWVKINAEISGNQITLGDFPKYQQMEELTGETWTGWEVPHYFDREGFYANPYADDLVSGYWAPVRELVKQRLTA